MTSYKKLIWRIKNLNKKNFAQNTNFYQMIIPVEKKRFIKETKIFLKKILTRFDNSKKKCCCGSGW